MSGPARPMRRQSRWDKQNIGLLFVRSYDVEADQHPVRSLVETQKPGYFESAQLWLEEIHGGAGFAKPADYTVEAFWLGMRARFGS